MRFLRSISWRLQLWHGAMLALVLAGFGATAWRYERTRVIRGVDQELERRVAPVADALRRGPGLRLPERDGNLFGGEPGRAFYYVAWSADGREAGRSASAPEDVPRPGSLDGPRAWRSRGRLREYVHCPPPGGDCVLVGREVAEELAGIRRFAWLLAAAGGTVFGLGLLGGWWISRCALRPIAEISATAARISTEDLSQRIPTADGGSELDDLARVLNETFARLQESFARQARFTADASHELRTPVTVVLTQAQSALARERPAAEYRETLLACQRAAQRMRRLVDSLLTLARLESGEARAPRAACDLDQVARDAVELMRPLAEERGVGLTSELGPARCLGNPEQLGQVVANLVGNAVQHSRREGSVTVRTTSEPGMAVLVVTDTGEGIAPADLPHVFERFYRADLARSSAAERTGLGLAIVKAIVDAHGGTVQVASEPARGSTFTVRLPTSPAPAVPVLGAIGPALLALALAVAAASTSAQEAESFGGDIVLGRPTDRSVTVSVLFPSDQDLVWLEYGPTAAQLMGRTPPQADVRAGVPFEETIEGLEPNRLYAYRVRYQGAGRGAVEASAVHSFRTQRPPGSTFTFTVVADSHLFTERHCNPARYALTLRNARDDAPDFHLDLGDTFRTDSIVRDPADLTFAKVLERVRAHRPYFGILTHSAPLFLALGNHESEYLWYTRADSGQNPGLPLWATNARLALYPNPAPDGFYSGDETAYPGVEGGRREGYYAWEWGDALFVVLDPYWGMGQHGGSSWDPVHGDEQYFWFRDTLRGSRARHKLVFEHHVLGQARGGVEVARQYEWGGVDPRSGRTFAEMRPGWDEPMHDLMVENGVTIYFQGHDHLFARGVLDGVTYVTVPMPGAGPPGSPDAFSGNEGDGNADAYRDSLVLPNSGHLRVTVSPDSVRVDYVAVRLPGWDAGANGEVVHSFVVR